jgi:formylmethanofuran dehydrogenase subunit D
MSNVITYKVEDVFVDDENDSKNVLMNIPPEVSARMGWIEGDVIKVSVEEGRMVLTKIEDQPKES